MSSRPVCSCNAQRTRSQVHASGAASLITIAGHMRLPLRMELTLAGPLTNGTQEIILRPNRCLLKHLSCSQTRRLVEALPQKNEHLAQEPRNVITALSQQNHMIFKNTHKGQHALQITIYKPISSIIYVVHRRCN